MIDKNELLNAEILKIDNLLTDMRFNDDYIYLIDHKDKIITLEYLDAYEYELITVQPLIFNEYGVLKYIVSVGSYDLDNELELNDYYYCKEIRISESKLKQIERQTNKQAEKYRNAKPFILTGWPEKMITVENDIFNRECFVNITHTHYYYGKTVTLETRDFNDIEPFLILRDFFKSVELKAG